jgi:tetratricopeptide (TPR) repeat protein
MARIKYLIVWIFFTGLTPVLLSGQNTAAYDDEILRIVGKIKQYPDRVKDIDKLKENYDLANKIDRDHLVSLLESGQPDIWTDVHTCYRKLDERQALIKSLPEKSIQLSGIQFVDYDRELKESKYKAAAYHYALGEKFLKSEKQDDARRAYIEFLKVANLDASFKDLDLLLRKAILKGATRIESELHNRTGKNVSPAMVDQLSLIVWEFKKASYGQEKMETIDAPFAFILRVVLDELLIGPDQVKEMEYQEERDIYIGDQVVDTIKCLITETRQLKKALLSGSIEYVDKQTGNVLNKVPLKVESVFSNFYASLQGDPRAAGDETRALLKAKKAAYPSTEQMTLDATEEFSRKALEIILAK